MALWRSWVRSPSGPPFINAKCKMQNVKINPEVKKEDILERAKEFSLRIIRFYRALESDNVGRILGRQLLRSGTSIGANLHEAKGGQSKSDFIAKVSIAQKEALETLYWLEVFKLDKSLNFADTESLIDETTQLIKILSAILIKSKRS